MPDSNRKETSPQDIAAFTKDSSAERTPSPTQDERDHESHPKPLVKIVDYGTGEVIQASLAELNQQMKAFQKVILLIEDTPDDSDTCANSLHELGYDGVQLITRLLSAEQHLDDIVAGLTTAPAAIVLDLGLGLDSGFTVLRKCHAEPKLQKIPILVWTRHTDSLSQTFSDYLGVQNFVRKTEDPSELREALRLLLQTGDSQIPTPSKDSSRH
jgi:CheY-like chemotaxis protein